MASAMAGNSSVGFVWMASGGVPAHRSRCACREPLCLGSMVPK